jgi:hypothetical protein
MQPATIIALVTFIFLVIYYIIIITTYSTHTFIFKQYEHPPVDPTKSAYNQPYGSQVMNITWNSECTPDAFAALAPTTAAEAQAALIQLKCAPSCKNPNPDWTTSGTTNGRTGSDTKDPGMGPCLDRTGAKVPVPPQSN